MRRIIGLFILVSIFVGSMVKDGRAAQTSSRYYTRTIGLGKITRNVNVVEIDMNNPSIALEVATPNDRLGGAENFLNMIKRKKPIAAINANFFRFYDTLEPLGAIMKNGRLVYLSGGNTTVSITTDRKIIFGEHQMYVKGGLDGKYENVYAGENTELNEWRAYLVNFIPYNNPKIKDSLLPYEKSTILYTPERGDKVSIQTKGIAILVDKSTVVKKQDTPSVVLIPKDGFVIFYGSQVDGDGKKYVEERFKVGRTVQYHYVSDKGNEEYWDKVQYAFACGPRLLEDGKERDLRVQGYKDPKIVSQSAQRSAFGVTKDNKVLMVTVPNVTMAQLAQIMKQLNAYNAINLDGGASSGLYYNGKMVTPPGRNLSTVLLVHENKK